MNNGLITRRGAPRGNQNARKHGFYSRALDKWDKKDFKRAASIEGLDEEIALVRLKLKTVLLHDPDNVKLIGHALLSLNRLLRTRNRLATAIANQGVLKEAIENVLKDVALPIGIDLTQLPTV